jgi:hypothetical protein
MRNTTDDICCDVEACSCSEGWVRHLVEEVCMIHCGCNFMGLAFDEQRATVGVLYSSNSVFIVFGLS